MPNINELDLTPEACPDIQWDAPESGSFPPQVKPGVHDFAFALDDEDPFKAVEIQGGRYLQVTYSATTNTADHGEVTLNFQRCSTFLNQAMREAHLNHMVGELLRSLAIRIEGSPTKERIADALQAATAEGRHFKGEVGWRRYCKACDQTISTHPRKKKGHVAWPRDANKDPELVVACPKCGDKGYGQAEVVRFKLPESGATQVHSSANGGSTSFPGV